MKGAFRMFMVCCAAAAVFGMALPHSSYGQPGNQPGTVAVAPAPGDEGQATYFINPLDRLLIVVYAGEKQTAQYERYVQSDGTVYLPYLEMDVKVGGLMLIAAQQKIEDISRKFIREPRVVITLMSAVTQNVSTYGKIETRTIDISTPQRVLQVIARAGGPTAGAIEDSIRVISTDGTVRLFNYRKVNSNPNLKDNFLLRPGDIIYVPGADDFSIMVFGDVKSTGSYRMKTGDRVLDALLKAGSWQTTADLKKVRLLRVIGRNRVEPNHLNLKRLFDEADTSQNLILQNGDIIFVPTTSQDIMGFTMILNVVYTIFMAYNAYLAITR